MDDLVEKLKTLQGGFKSENYPKTIDCKPGKINAILELWTMSICSETLRFEICMNSQDGACPFDRFCPNTISPFGSQPKRYSLYHDLKVKYN